MSAFNWMAGWFLFILILIALAHTQVGEPIVYYLLWLMIILLLVSHYKEINTVFMNAGIIQNVNGGTNG